MSDVVYNPAPVSRPPRRPPPPGACDAHAHVFGPFDRFPARAVGAYAPPLAPYQAYRAMLHCAGMARGVIVQPTVYLEDCSALMDACARSGGAVRGVGVATGDTSDAALEAMVAAGVCGVRFTEVADPVSGGRYAGSVAFAEAERLAPRLRALGLQAQLWADCAWIAQNAARIAALGVPVAIDHMGRFDIARGVHDAAFQTLLGLLADGVVWVKLPVCRASQAFSDYPDARPFFDALARANPDRLVWGSDWPHVRLFDKTPDVGHLLDLFNDWMGCDATLAARILVDNPAALFGFQPWRATQDLETEG